MKLIYKNIVHDWCTRWNMTVNTDKTQIVHFSTQSRERTGFIFIYGEQNINVVSQYKYLGLILNEHLDYALMAKMVAKSACRALGLLIAKCKASGRMPYNVYTKLYDALVQQIINNGAGIWGAKDFLCINSVQHRACHLFLGVGKYTPNVAVEGEMAWSFPQQRTWAAVTRLWCRLPNMENRLIK